MEEARSYVPVKVGGCCMGTHGKGPTQLGHEPS
jgi:hypothetical protein